MSDSTLNKLEELALWLKTNGMVTIGAWKTPVRFYCTITRADITFEGNTVEEAVDQMYEHWASMPKDRWFHFTDFTPGGKR